MHCLSSLLSALTTSIVSAQQDLQSQSQASHVDEATSMAGAEISQPPPRRVRPRGTIVSTFRGFDDGFDPSQILAQKKLGVENSQLRNGSNGTHRDSVKCLPSIHVAQV